LAFAADPFPASVGDGTWQWVDIEGSKCMDGSQTGVFVKYSQQTSTKLGIYMYGGGACFNSITCDTASQGNHPGAPGLTGIFETRSDNSLTGYNWIAVPYCTGDVHMGDNVASAGGKSRNFAGHKNLELMMERAVLSFSKVENLIVTGESAGGFGALASYEFLRNHYPAARSVLLDDSGPILDNEALAPCLQSKWRNLWAMNKNLPSDCSCNNDGGDLVDIWGYLKQKFPKDSFSLVSSVEDGTIGLFFAFGRRQCTALLPIGYSGLADGLQRLSDTGVPVYMIAGNTHTHTGDKDEYYSRTVNNVPLYKWIEQLVDPSQPDPESVSPTAAEIARAALEPGLNRSSTVTVVV